MIDLSNEEVLSLSDAARALPSVHGRRIHPSTLWRWARKGIKGQRLEYLRIGRAIVTTRRALNDFAARLAAADAAPGISPTLPQQSTRRPRSDAQRTQDIARAEARLHQAGA